MDYLQVNKKIHIPPKLERNTDIMQERYDLMRSLCVTPKTGVQVFHTEGKFLFLIDSLSRPIVGCCAEPYTLQ